MLKNLLDLTLKSRNVMINCRRKKYNCRKNFPHHHWLEFSSYKRLLQKNLSMESSDVYTLLESQQKIFNLPKDHLVKQCKICMQLNIDTSTLYKDATLLEWSRPILINRTLLLREMGVENTHAALVSNFNSTMYLTMSMFKAYMEIPRSFNVAHNLLKYLESPPPDAPPFETPSDNLSVFDYHQHCWRWYVKWKYQLSEENVKDTNKVLYSLKNRSFRVTRKLFDILHYELGFTIGEIIRNNYLKCGSPDDLRKIIDNVETFGNVDLKQLIKTVPALHKMQYDNAIGVMSVLEKRGFNKKSITRHSRLLVIPKARVVARCNKFESTPELHVLRYNRNALKMINEFNKVYMRLSYIRYLNIKFATMFALTGRWWDFERFIKTGTDKSMGREIITSLEEPLKLEFNDIRQRLKKHPYWRHVDLLSMHDSLNFLLERFNPEDLHDNIHLILYPREKICEALSRLSEVQQKSQTWNKNQVCSPRHILAMCMYEIEREHHFTGDGVWKYEAPSPRLIGTLKTDDNEFSDHSDCVNSENEDIDRTALRRL